jgi:hypothetical protein
VTVTVAGGLTRVTVGKATVSVTVVGVDSVGGAGVVAVGVAGVVVVVVVSGLAAVSVAAGGVVRVGVESVGAVRVGKLRVPLTEELPLPQDDTARAVKTPSPAAATSRAAASAVRIDVALRKIVLSKIICPRFASRVRATLRFGPAGACVPGRSAPRRA